LQNKNVKFFQIPFNIQACVNFIQVRMSSRSFRWIFRVFFGVFNWNAFRRKGPEIDSDLIMPLHVAENTLQLKKKTGPVRVSRVSIIHGQLKKQQKPGLVRTAGLATSWKIRN